MSKSKGAAGSAPAIEGEHRSGPEPTWLEVLRIQERVEKNPYAMVAAALGVGYLLGGGLFTPTTARILGLGAKLAAIPMVRNSLLDIAEAAVEGMLEGTREGAEGNGATPVPPGRPTA